MPNVLCRLPNHVGDCCMTLPALRLLEASGFTPMLTGKRWAEDLMSGMGWRFDPIEGHVTEDLHRIRYISNHLGPRPLGLLFPNSFSSALLFSIGRVRNAGFPTDGRRFLLDKVVEEPGTMHEVERFFRLAHGAIKAWGGTPAWDSVPEELGMRLLARHEAAARNLMAEHDIPENFALLAPIARGLHHGKEKQWKHFNELCGPLRDMGIEPSSSPPCVKRKPTMRPVRTPEFFRPPRWAIMRLWQSAPASSLPMTRASAMSLPPSAPIRSRSSASPTPPEPVLGTARPSALATIRTDGPRLTKFCQR